MTTNTTAAAGIRIISDEPVLHRSQTVGPRIERVQVFELPGGERVTVNHWYQNGRLVRVA